MTVCATRARRQRSRCACAAPRKVLGDCEPVGEGVSEMRIHYGPGYRVYFKRTGMEVVILLAGGDKSTQAKDIRMALKLAREI